MVPGSTKPGSTAYSFPACKTDGISYEMSNRCNDNGKVSIRVRDQAVFAVTLEPNTKIMGTLYTSSGGVKKVVKVKIVDGSVDISVEEKMVETVTIDDDEV